MVFGNLNSVLENEQTIMEAVESNILTQQLLSGQAEKKQSRVSKILYSLSHYGMNYSDQVMKKITQIELLGYSKFPICIAKTQYSISDDPKKLGYPKNYEIYVKDIAVYTGAGFIVTFGKGFVHLFFHREGPGRLKKVFTIKMLTFFQFFYIIIR